MKSLDYFRRRGRVVVRKETTFQFPEKSGIVSASREKEMELPP